MLIEKDDHDFTMGGTWMGVLGYILIILVIALPFVFG